MGDVNEIKQVGDGFFVDTGCPHYVLWEQNLDCADVYNIGKQIRYSPPFEKVGPNVDFVKLEGNNQLSMRTYESGVEDETLSCGTGATASALVAARIHGYSSPITVNVKGGVLNVSFKCSED